MIFRLDFKKQHPTVCCYRKTVLSNKAKMWKKWKVYYGNFKQKKAKEAILILDEVDFSKKKKKYLG